MWTSPARRGHLAICVQWVDGGYKLRKALLGLPQVAHSQSGERQAEHVLGVFRSYGITTKIGYYTGDNATSNDTLLKALSGHLTLGLALEAALKATELAENADPYEILSATIGVPMAQNNGDGVRAALRLPLSSLCDLVRCPETYPMDLLNMTSEMIHVVKFLLPAFRMATQNCLTTRTSAGKRLISPTRSVKFSEPRFALAESNAARTKLPQKHFDLFIEPRGGFTQNLFALSYHGPTTRRAMFSGPHGKKLPVHSYENVVMLATGFGIAAHLPYLRKLIHARLQRAGFI
ncbi:metalloreductase transmembrane component [Beauveria bassiana ARSEF 2860]|uniref:Metalloreductase transmembrane component n=1 Tax=Beauveria bassiana (strain ARSEF 2860) TaxID=655819 RepID=J4VPT1_BEAB2|nr:metalloreductase transmembrane component [Beauveria bassiana ARSEF 2860]EJP60725.1 metalloreductase transmembrane component [Beauveria bassiana ARSEF 2860]